MLSYALPDLEATETFGQMLATVVRAGDVIALSGVLGAGKTSLARAMLAALGLESDAPSPTFAIVQPYAPPELRIPVWHVDLYRLESVEEANELGLEEAREDAVLVIEWPERLGALLWLDTLQLTIEIDVQGQRRLTVKVPPAWEGRWPPP